VGARLGKALVVCYIESVSDDSVLTEPKPAKKKSLKERLAANASEYGSIAIYTYLTLSILTIAAFSIAFGVGLAPSSASGVGGVIFAGWVAAKATMPLRILATLALTPLVATLVKRRRARKPVEEEVEED
jgi:hypothetical protein